MGCHPSTQRKKGDDFQLTPLGPLPDTLMAMPSRPAPARLHGQFENPRTAPAPPRSSYTRPASDPIATGRGTEKKQGHRKHNSENLHHASSSSRNSGGVTGSAIKGLRLSGGAEAQRRREEEERARQDRERRAAEEQRKRYAQMQQRGREREREREWHTRKQLELRGLEEPRRRPQQTQQQQSQPQTQSHTQPRPPMPIGPSASSWDPSTTRARPSHDSSRRREGSAGGRSGGKKRSGRS